MTLCVCESIYVFIVTNLYVVWIVGRSVRQQILYIWLSHFWIETIVEQLSSWVSAHCLIYLSLSIVCSPLFPPVSYWVNARKIKQGAVTGCDISTRIWHNICGCARLFWVFFCMYLCLYTNANTNTRCSYNWSLCSAMQTNCLPGLHCGEAISYLVKSCYSGGTKNRRISFIYAERRKPTGETGKIYSRNRRNNVKETTACWCKAAATKCIIHPTLYNSLGCHVAASLRRLIS